MYETKTESKEKFSRTQACKISMDKIEGVTLWEAIQTKKFLKPKLIVKWSVQLVEFFSSLQEIFGIAHGDIKLDNFMIDKARNDLYVIDWGGALWAHADKTTTLVGNLQTCGPQFIEISTLDESNPKASSKSSSSGSNSKSNGPRKSYSGLKNDSWMLANIISMLFTGLHGHPVSVLGAAWDEHFEDCHPEMLAKFQRQCWTAAMKEITKDHPSGPYRNVPAFFRRHIANWMKWDENPRKFVSECVREMTKATVVVSGDSYKLYDDMLRNPFETNWERRSKKEISRELGDDVWVPSFDILVGKWELGPIEEDAVLKVSDSYPVKGGGYSKSDSKVSKGFKNASKGSKDSNWGCDDDDDSDNMSVSSTSRSSVVWGMVAKQKVRKELGSTKSSCSERSREGKTNKTSSKTGSKTASGGSKGEKW